MGGDTVERSSTGNAWTLSGGGEGGGSWTRVARGRPRPAIWMITRLQNRSSKGFDTILIFMEVIELPDDRIRAARHNDLSKLRQEGGGGSGGERISGEVQFEV